MSNVLHFQVTVVDTPGFGMNITEEEATIDKVVDFLRNDIMFVHAFVIALKQTDNRPTYGLRNMLRLFARMFGKSFWNNVILEGTFWSFAKHPTRQWIFLNIIFLMKD